MADPTIDEADRAALAAALKRLMIHHQYVLCVFNAKGEPMSTIGNLADPAAIVAALQAMQQMLTDEAPPRRNVH